MVKEVHSPAGRRGTLSHARQNTFLVKHLKKVFNVKRAQFCFSRAYVELEESKNVKFYFFVSSSWASHLKLCVAR